MRATIRRLAAVLLASVTQLAMDANVAAAGANEVTQGIGLSETDMGHSGTTAEGKVTVPWNLLGGAVGDRTVDGVKVELYVLQAQEPEKLKPGDPNHAFTVTLKDATTSEFLRQGEVWLAVAGTDGTSPRTAMSARSNGIFRSGVALPRPGQYRLTIAFQAAGRSGRAEFPYAYRPLAEGAPAHRH